MLDGFRYVICRMYATRVVQRFCLQRMHVMHLPWLCKRDVLFRSSALTQVYVLSRLIV